MFSASPEEHKDDAPGLAAQKLNQSPELRLNVSEPEDASKAGVEHRPAEEHSRRAAVWNDQPVLKDQQVQATDSPSDDLARNGSSTDLARSSVTTLDKPTGNVIKDKDERLGLEVVG